MAHYPHRDFRSEEDQHHHHHPHLPHFSSRPPHQREGYDDGSYAPPHAYDHNAHAPPPGPYGAHPPSGPYGSHDSSGQFHPHPHGHDPAHHGKYPPELPHHGRMLPEGQILRIFCQGNSAFNLAVENNTVVMQQSHSQDEAQQWIKDSSYGLRVKDNYGYPAFSLVNKKTGKVLKHSKKEGKQVLLMDYHPNIHDDDILWSESQDFGEGFKTLRCASDTLLNLTIFEGQKKIRNGSALVLDTWHKGDHQLWKLFPM